jgi:hypothetical protein
MRAMRVVDAGRVARIIVSSLSLVIFALVVAVCG